MEKYGALLRWWLIFTLICFGMVLLFITGLIGKINEADVTKLSFLIGGLFMYFTIQIGICHYKLIKARAIITRIIVKKVKKTANLCSFWANVLQDLGMFGTVVGFIYMLSLCFGDVSTANMASLRLALKDMGTGMGTALWTTAAGLLCSMLLRIQLYPLIKIIESKEVNNEGNKI